MLKVPDDVYKAFTQLCEKSRLDKEKSRIEDQQSLPFLDLFKEPQLRKNVILTILLYVSTYLIFDGHCRNIENLDFSIYISFTISSFLELPSDLLSIVGMDYIGRRWSSAISLALSGVFLLPCAWIQGWYSKI